MTLFGELELHGARELDAFVRPVLDPHLPLTLDLAPLASTQPEALEALLRRQRSAAQAGSEMRIRIAPHQVADLLEAQEDLSA